MISSILTFQYYTQVDASSKTQPVPIENQRIQEIEQQFYQLNKILWLKIDQAELIQNIQAQFMLMEVKLYQIERDNLLHYIDYLDRFIIKKSRMRWLITLGVLLFLTNFVQCESLYKVYSSNNGKCKIVVKGAITEKNSFNSCEFQGVGSNFPQTEYEWKHCIRHCCLYLTSSKIPSNDQYFQLYRCIRRSQDQTSILSIIIYFVMLVLMILSVLYLFLRIRANCQRERLRKATDLLTAVQKQSITQRIEEITWIDSKNKPQKPHSDISLSVQRVSQEQICAICNLDYPNTQMLCLHQFHTTCLAQHYQSTQKCPLCSLTSLFLRINCRACKTYFILPSLNFTRYFQAQSNPIYCDSCSQNIQMRQRTLIGFKDVLNDHAESTSDHSYQQKVEI